MTSNGCSSTRLHGLHLDIEVMVVGAPLMAAFPDIKVLVHAACFLHEFCVYRLWTSIFCIWPCALTHQM